MVYDYTNQHIIIYNPVVRYSGQANPYPEALAMADGAKLVDSSKPVAENITAIIISRPFKIDNPDTFKTINTGSVRYARIVLYLLRKYLDVTC